MVLAALKMGGVAGNTIVMFSSDNGLEWTAGKRSGSNFDPDANVTGSGVDDSIEQAGGQRGRKRSLFEGGVLSCLLCHPWLASAVNAKRAKARSRRWLRGVLLVSSFIVAHSAFAQTGVRLDLVSEQTAIVPGKPFTVGLWLQHDRGYHTYWRVPGIVGVPTQMKWNLPRGWKAGPLIYPEPERTLMFQIKAQGFDRDVMLRSEITPPSDLSPGDSITLTGTASWMCCGRACHPGSKELSLTLPVTKASALNKKWHKLLNEERARAEQPSDAWKATAREKDNVITLHLKPVSDKARLTKNKREADKIIAFTEDGCFDTDKPQTIERHDDGSLTITLTKPDAQLGERVPKTLRVILRNDSGWLQDGKLRSLQIAPEIAH